MSDLFNDENLAPPEAVRDMWAQLSKVPISRVRKTVYLIAACGSVVATFYCLIFPSTALALAILTIPPIAAILRDAMGDKEKLAWVVISILLILGVARGLKKDGRDNRDAQLTIANSFKVVGDDVGIAIRQNDLIMRQAETALEATRQVGQLASQNLQKTQENLNYSTGGDEFCFLVPMAPHIGSPPTPNGMWPVYVSNSGSIPLPFCDLRIIGEKFSDALNVRVPSLEGGGPYKNFPTEVSIVPGPPYRVNINTPLHFFYEIVNFSSDPSAMGGYRVTWKVFDLKGTELLNSEH
jgi:hypothetical protein